MPTPRHLTVLSIFLCPSRIFTARKLPVRLYISAGLVHRSERVP